jgi:electron transfer flavoprotein beta subunit
MTPPYSIVVCGSLVPDPLQVLEPASESDGPALKNEAMLPAVLDPWAAHALFEAAHLAAENPASRVYLVSVGPKSRLQQLMMSVAQKARFELVAIDGPASGFIDAEEVARALAESIRGIEGLDRERLLLFGGCASASRDAGVTLPMVGEMLEIMDQFLAVDELLVQPDGSMVIRERIEGGRYLASLCTGPPVVLGWATGKLPEPPNNPQTGMLNMRTIIPALQKARTVALDRRKIRFHEVIIPPHRRETRIVKDKSVDEMAQEIVDWIRA